MESPPDHLKAWDEERCKAALPLLMAADPFPADATEIRIPSLHGLTSLPGWLCRHSALQTLDLSGRPGYPSKLTSLPAELANLASLQTLDLGGCDALTGMPDLSGLPQLQVKDLPDHLKAWEAGGRKAGTFERR